MSNRFTEELLETMKCSEVNSDLLTGIKISHLALACAAWSESEVKLNDVEENIDGRSALWKSCKFNKDKWLSILTFLPEGNLLYKLIHSNLIYPDGTYNQEWIIKQKIQEALKWQKKK